ncbi:MAG: hypothetical protein IJF07_09940 [Lachnospiraceae bacterium]|nr:hypothetical protein [Lachnospiraceae bacterium]
MAVMDEFREEREALKNGTKKEKWNYFWYYYKWHVIISICVILVVSSFVYQLVTRKEIAFNAVMLNASPMTESTEYKDTFAQYAGIDLEENEIYFDTTIRITEDSMDTYASLEKLAVYTAAAELDAMITDLGSFQKYANSSTFYDLREILTEEQLNRYEPYFYYVDRKVVLEIEAANDALDSDYVPVYPDPTKPEEMSDPVPVGIYLTDNKGLTENFYFRGEGIAIGIYCNTTHLDTTLKFLEYTFSE